MNSRRTFFGWLGAFLSAPFAPRASTQIDGRVSYYEPEWFKITSIPYVPRIGDVVLYTLPGGINEGKQRPATIVEIGDEDVNLQVMLDGDNDDREPPLPPPVMPKIKHVASESDPRENRSASLLYRLYGRPSEIRAGHTAFNALCPIQVEDIGYWNDILVRFDPKLMDHELGWIKNRTSAVANTVKGWTSSAMILSYSPTYPGVFKISGAIRVNSVSDGNLTISAQWTDSQNISRTYTFPAIVNDGEFMLLPVQFASDGCMPIYVIATVAGSGTINYDANCAIEKIAA